MWVFIYFPLSLRVGNRLLRNVKIMQHICVWCIGVISKHYFLSLCSFFPLAFFLLFTPSFRFKFGLILRTQAYNLTICVNFFVTGRQPWCNCTRLIWIILIFLRSVYLPTHLSIHLSLLRNKSLVTNFWKSNSGRDFFSNSLIFPNDGNSIEEKC